MSQRVTVVLTDDIDGSVADSTQTFALNGISYEIDLNEANTEALKAALAPWIAAARKAGGRAATSRAGRGSVRSKRGEVRELREWARANGYTVSDRGRISAEVQSAFRAAH